MTVLSALPQLLYAVPLIIAWTIVCGLAGGLWVRELRTPALVLGSAGGLGLLTTLASATFNLLFLAVLQETDSVTDGWLTTDRWLDVAQVFWTVVSLSRWLAHALLVAAVFVGRRTP